MFFPVQFLYAAVFLLYAAVARGELVDEEVGLLTVLHGRLYPDIFGGVDGYINHRGPGLLCCNNIWKSNSSSDKGSYSNSGLISLN